MTGARPHLVVLEPAAKGHGREWLLHLAASAQRRDPMPRLVFSVAAPVAAALREDLGGERWPAVVALTEREAALCTHANLAVSGMARWWVMRRYLAATGATEGLFLELDHLTLPLAFGLPMGAGRTVSGILFRPSVHYETVGRPRLRERVRDLRKDLLYRLMLRRPDVRQVHSLDDGFPAWARVHYRGGSKVTVLPDPAFPRVEPTAEDRALAAQAPAGRVLFILFGVLTERKGVLAVLHALARLDHETARNVAVIVAGAVDPSIQAEVDSALCTLARVRPSLWIHLEARYLRLAEIAALIDRSDVVLAPYQRFVGSSGVLMWAASRGRPVIAQDYGLVGRLTREHGLGLTADTTDPDALARAIAAAAAARGAGLADLARLSAFTEGLTPDAFASRILDPVVQAARQTAASEAPQHGTRGRPAEQARAVTE